MIDVRPLMGLIRGLSTLGMSVLQKSGWGGVIELAAATLAAWALIDMGITRVIDEINRRR